MDDLLPCPFCGTKAIQRPHEKIEGIVMVRCPSGQCTGCHWTPSDWWNTRIDSGFDKALGQFSDSLRAEREKYDNLHTKIGELINLSYIGLCAVGYKEQTDKLASELGIIIDDSDEAILRRLDSS